VAQNDYGMSNDMERGRNVVRDFASQAAEKAKGAAAYLRQRPMNDLVKDVRQYVVKHPETALVGAVVVGFIAGRLLRRDY